MKNIWISCKYAMNIFKGFHGKSIHSAPRSGSNGGIARRVMREKKKMKMNYENCINHR